MRSDDGLHPSSVAARLPCHSTPSATPPQQRARSRRVLNAARVSQFVSRSCAGGAEHARRRAANSGKLRRNPVGNQDLFPIVSGLLRYSHDSASDGNLKGLSSQSGSNTAGPGLASSSELGAVEGLVGSLAGDESTGGKAGLGGGGNGLEGEGLGAGARHCLFN